MPNRIRNLIVAAAAALAFSPVLFAQGGRPAGQAAESKPAPRLPDGKPDLSGIWFRSGQVNRYFSNGSSPNVTTAEEAMRPEAREKFKAQLASGKIRTIDRDLFDPYVKACAPVGITRLINEGGGAGRPFEIIHLANRIFMHYEWDHWPRDIWMDGRAHPANQLPTWMGHSIGKWDGDTLVVDTVGFNDLTWLDTAGHPHSQSLHMVERYRRVNSDTMEIQVTFEDPEIYTKPLVGNTMTLRLSPNIEFTEWVTCDDRIRIVLETEVCKISAGWEFEAYCVRREKGLPTNVPASGPAPPGY